VQLGLPWWIGAGQPRQGLELAAETGYDFVELSLDAPWPDGLDPMDLADTCDELGVGLGIHAPWRTQALAHPREPLARAAREIAQDCLAIARTAEARYIVFHVEAPDFRGYPRREVLEEGLQTAHASLQALARSAGDEVDVIVENTGSPMGTPQEVAAFLDPLTEVGFCLDPGHAAIQAHRDGNRWDLDTWSHALGDPWQLTHIMDLVETEAGIRDHLMPGAGEADLDAILDATREADADRVLVEAFYADTDRTEPRKGDWREARKLLTDG